jgi:hypothetical protein
MKWSSFFQLMWLLTNLLGLISQTFRTMFTTFFQTLLSLTDAVVSTSVDLTNMLTRCFLYVQMLWHSIYISPTKLWLTLPVTSTRNYAQLLSWMRYAMRQGSISPTYLRSAFTLVDPKSVKRLTTWLSFLRFWAPHAWKLYVERWWNSALEDQHKCSGREKKW